MNITAEYVVKSRIPEYLAKREQWDRDQLREQCFEQSARTVAGARAEFTHGPLTEADQYALDETLDGRVQVAE
jgi:hypothetical protein